MTTPPVPLWRQRDFRIAWSAGFVNDTGDWVLNVALPIFVFIETGSGSATRCCSCVSCSSAPVSDQSEVPSSTASISGDASSQRIWRNQSPCFHS